MYRQCLLYSPCLYEFSYFRILLLYTPLCQINEYKNWSQAYNGHMSCFSGMGYIVGALASSAANDWRWALRVTPILGTIAVGMILWAMEDPQRGAAEESQMKPTSYRQDLDSLVRKWVWVFLWNTPLHCPTTIIANNVHKVVKCTL